MKRRLIAITMCLGLSASVVSAGTVFTDRTAWEAAVAASLFNEQFPGLPAAGGVATPVATAWGQVDCDSGQVFGIVGGSGVGMSVGAQFCTYTADDPASVVGFGFDLGPNQFSQVRVVVSDGTSTLLNTSFASGTFFGWVRDLSEEFASVRIRGDSGLVTITDATFALRDLVEPTNTEFRVNSLPGRSTPGNLGTVRVLGDMWSFRCPAGGSVSFMVDTHDDTGAGNSSLAPVVEIVDAKGNVVDFEVDNSGSQCSIPPTCQTDWECPVAIDVACGTGVHTLSIFSWPETTCTADGGYDLLMQVKNKNGKLLTPNQMKLGGGPARQLPSWTLQAFAPGGPGKKGPLLDDEGIPVIALPMLAEDPF